MTGDPESGVGEMMRTYLTDTPPVEKGGSQSRVIIVELTTLCCEANIRVDGDDGESVFEMQ